MAADVAARLVAQDQLAAQVRAAVPAAGSARARIRSFPFLSRLLTSGRISEVDATVLDVTVEGLRFESIKVDVHGVQLNRDLLVRDRRLVLEDIRWGRVNAEVTQEAISEVVGVPVRLEEGRASVTIAGRTLGADVEVRDGRLIISVAGFSLPTIRVTAPLLPCVGDARIVTGRVVLSCDFTELPEELRTDVPLVRSRSEEKPGTRTGHRAPRVTFRDRSSSA